MTKPTLNLKEFFGHRFNVGYDPAAETYAERQNPWMMTLCCMNGVIYPHGSTLLAVECKGTTAKRLMDLPGVTVHQQGDMEWTLLFDVAIFEAVAAIVKPRKRRRLTEDQRAGNVERLKAFRFKTARIPMPENRPRTIPASPKRLDSR